MGSRNNGQIITQDCKVVRRFGENITKVSDTCSKIVLEEFSSKRTFASFYANYDDGIDGTWGSSPLTGTGIGSPVITDSKLDLTGGTNKSVDYSLAIDGPDGAVRFLFTPDYTGIPAAGTVFFQLWTGPGQHDSNVVFFMQETDGTMQLWITDSDGNEVISFVSFGVYNQSVSGTEVEIELNWDLVNGPARLFIDGVQFGATLSGTGTRSVTTDLRVSSQALEGRVSNFTIDDFLVFNSVQHTSDYTPGQPIPAQYIDFLGQPV